MEISDVEISEHPGKSFQAKVTGGYTLGTNGYWVELAGWGSSEAEAREQLAAALAELKREAAAFERVVGPVSGAS